MAAENPYKLTAADEAEITNWAKSYNINAAEQIGEANKLLLSGQAVDMTDLRRIAADRGSPAKPLNVASYTPAPATPMKTADTPLATTSAYSAAGYTPKPYAAADWSAEGYDPKAWNVIADQTVESRLEGLLKKGSPLLTLAETKAKQGMASKGLLNSSMAEGEALRATTETALPIASADAATLANAARFNTDSFNTAAQFLANARNAAASQNATAKNQAAAFAAEAANQAAAFGAQAANQAAAFNAQAKNAASLEQARAASNAAIQATADANRFKQLEMQAKNEARQFEAEAVNRKAEVDATIAADLELANLQNRARASEQAVEIVTSAANKINEIMANPELEPGPKQEAVNQIKAQLSDTLTFVEKASGIEGLKELVTFPSSKQNTETQTQTQDETPYAYPEYDYGYR